MEHAREGSSAEKRMNDQSERMSEGMSERSSTQRVDFIVILPHSARRRGGCGLNGSGRTSDMDNGSAGEHALAFNLGAASSGQI